MRAPPPLHVDAGASPGWRAVRAGLAGAAVGVPLAWAAPWVAAGSPAWFLSSVASEGAVIGGPGVTSIALTTAAALVGLACGCARWRALSRRDRDNPPARLRWDGTAWSLVAAPGAVPVPGTPVLVLDLGGWLLVRFQARDPAGRKSTAWLPLTASRDPAGGCALRAALWTWPAEARQAAR